MLLILFILHFSAHRCCIKKFAQYLLVNIDQRGWEGAKYFYCTTKVLRITIKNTQKMKCNCQFDLFKENVSRLPSAAMMHKVLFVAAQRSH